MVKSSILVNWSAVVLIVAGAISFVNGIHLRNLYIASNGILAIVTGVATLDNIKMDKTYKKRIEDRDRVIEEQREVIRRILNKNEI